MTATPLQMANAYAAIANGGMLRKPYIVESIKNLETDETETHEPQMIRRVLSEETSQQMRLMLAGVTSGKGSGLAARVPGYIVGGKTGTAQKVKIDGRGYIPGGYIASFTGFIPANDPQYVIYIALDHPKKGYYGSQVAAPIFAGIASYAVRRDGVAPEVLADKNVSVVPGVQIADQKIEKITLKKLKKEIQLMTAAPDLNSLTIREVLNKVSAQQIKVKFMGKGQVDQTWPAAGEALGEDRSMTIFLKE